MSSHAIRFQPVIFSFHFFPLVSYRFIIYIITISVSFFPQPILRFWSWRYCRFGSCCVLKCRFYGKYWHSFCIRSNHRLTFFTRKPVRCLNTKSPTEHHQYQSQHCQHTLKHCSLFTDFSHFIHFRLFIHSSSFLLILDLLYISVIINLLAHQAYRNSLIRKYTTIHFVHSNRNILSFSMCPPFCLLS